MSFLYPLGLLGLIGIPILILVYIIKTKYTEQTIASTYLWRLSEKFLKRKNPISRLAGIISLILQILAVTVLSLAIAHPILTVPAGADEYCFILDGSGSMNMAESDGTRFEIAKNRINEVIDSSGNGSLYTLIYVGDTTLTVYEKSDDPELCKLLLSELQPSYSSPDISEAMTMAQRLFSANPGAELLLFTDTDYLSHQNVKIVNVSSEVKNYSISDMSYTYSGNDLTVTGNVISHKGDAVLNVGLYLSGYTSPVSSVAVTAAEGEHTPFTVTAKTAGFSSVRCAIEESDSLAEDNEYVIFNVQKNEMFKTLIVSDNPFFLKSSISSAVSADIDTVPASEYTGTAGYGLYVFDSFVPDSLPTDGTVWLVNVDGSVSGSGFSVQREISFETSAVLERSSSTSSVARALLKDTLGDQIHVTEYIKCAPYRSFTTLYSYNSNPIIFAGVNANGNRQVVFGFDLHKSNIAVLYDYPVLIRNLVDYSFPEIVDRTDFVSGDRAEINVIANCDSIRVDSPLGNVSYLDTTGAFATLPLDEVGTYRITMTVAGSPRIFNVFSAMQPEESVPSPISESADVIGDAADLGIDGIRDLLTAAIIALAVLFSADWMVYCYEKYQLR